MKLNQTQFLRCAVAFTAIACMVSSSDVAQAQAHRYMDDAGNIYFVDKVAKIPKRYRDQVIAPTPAPVLTKETIELMRRKSREEEEKKERERRDEERQRAERARKLSEQQRIDDRQIRQMDDSRQLERVTR